MKHLLKYPQIKMTLTILVSLFLNQVTLHAQTYDLQLTNKRFTSGNPEHMPVDLQIRANQSITIGGNGKQLSNILVNYTNRGSGPGEIVPDTLSGFPTGYDIVMTDESTNNQLSCNIKKTGGTFTVGTTYSTFLTIVLEMGNGTNGSETISLSFDPSTTLLDDRNNQMTQGNLYSISNSALPVEFKEITYRVLQDQIVIKRSTASETMNDRFLLETSSDGLSFNSRGTIQASRKASDASYD